MLQTAYCCRSKSRVKTVTPDTAVRVKLGSCNVITATVYTPTRTRVFCRALGAPVTIHAPPLAVHKNTSLVLTQNFGNVRRIALLYDTQSVMVMMAQYRFG